MEKISPGSLLGDPIVQQFAINALIAIVFAVFVATATGWLLKQERAPGKVMALFCGLLVLVLSVAGWRLFSHHGAWHASIVYSIFEHGIPPEFPLFAGEPVQYHYTFHILVAKSMQVIRLAPPWFFALLNIVTLLLTFIALDRLASRIDENGQYRALASVLALVGFAVFINAPIGSALHELVGLPDTSSIDALHKFSTVNNNQVGILFFVVASLGFADLVRGSGRVASYFLISVGYLGMGLFYPLMVPAYGVLTAAAAGQMLLFSPVRRYKESALILGVMLAGALALLPWINYMSGDRAASAGIQLFAIESLGSNTYLLVCSLLIPGAIFAAYSSTLRIEFLKRSPVLVFLGLALLGLQISFLFSILGLSASLERKLLTASQIPLGLLIALPFREFFRQYIRVSVLTLALILLPVSFQWGPILVRGWAPIDPATTSGISFIHKDPTEQAVYEWIIRNTDGDAVFVDSYLTIPVFARRTLYVGVDYRRDSIPRDSHDGWSLSAEYFITKTNGTPHDVIGPRLKVVAELLLPSDESLDESLIRKAVAEMTGRPLYVVSRERTVSTRLAGADASLVRKVFANDAATIFELVGVNRN